MGTIHEGVDWDAVAAIRSSKRREGVLAALADGPKYAADIANKLDYSQGTVSKDFPWMKYRDPPLIMCLTPERPHHVIYGITEAGNAVVDHV